MRRRRALWSIAAAIGLLGATIAFVASAAQAAAAIDPIGGGVFQLDGDAQQSTPANTPGDDWDQVCHEVSATSCPNAGDTTGAIATSWTVDGNSLSALNASIFTGGGSKDPSDINQWAWKDNAGGLPDKDNLLHSFAVRYSKTPSTSCPSGTAATCEVLYFGSDRYDNSGDAQQGFWFFQNKISLGTNAVGGGTGFVGVHKPGDLLVVSDFSNGGTTSIITVYKWNPAVSGNLELLATSDAAKCAPSLPVGTAFCGIVNPASNTPSPWPFLDKSAKSTFLNGEFFEAGINLSTLGFGNECFSSVMSETRSSTSTTATLKDFVLGNFGKCEASLKTQVSSASVNPGTSVHDTATVKGNRPSLTPSGSVTFYMCSFATGSTAACDASDAAHTGTALTPTGTLSGSGDTATADSPNVNTAANPLTPGHYCFRAEWPGDPNYVPDPPATKFVEYSVTTECFEVLQSTTGTVTEPRLSNGTTAITAAVPVNTSVTDHALITGATGFGDPTGTVTFRICSPSEVTGAAGSEVCPAGAGTTIGSPVTASVVAGSTPPKTEALSTPAFTANAVGVWCFAATYTPDTANYSGSSDASHNECFTTVNRSTGTVTDPRVSGTTSAISGAVAVGTNVVDHAVITGATGFGSPTGSVTFRICNPSQVTGTAGSEVCPSGSGTQVGSAVTVTAVGGSSPPQTQATSSPAVAANSVGVWCFSATYTPDTISYTGSGDSTHGECFTVRDASSGTSAQKWLPNDHVVLTTTGGTALTGTLSITLRSGSCTGTVKYTEPTNTTLTNFASGGSVDTTNSTFFVSAAANDTPYFWSIVFTPSSSFVDGFTKCESTSITITD
jgi:hypothetical protein